VTQSDETEAMEERPTIYEFAGGYEAFVALAAALHERCVSDPVLSHPFSHAQDPNHLDHLASYLAEVFGGPPSYSESVGGHSSMLTIHAGTGAGEEYTSRFLTCFDLAVGDAALPDDEEFRRVLHDYMCWATSDVGSISPLGSTVAEGLTFPHWSWDGAQS
jgi:hemoglobin